MQEVESLRAENATLRRENGDLESWIELFIAEEEGGEGGVRTKNPDLNFRAWQGAVRAQHIVPRAAHRSGGPWLRIQHSDCVFGAP